MLFLGLPYEDQLLTLDYYDDLVRKKLDRNIQERSKNIQVDQVLTWNDPLIEHQWTLYVLENYAKKQYIISKNL